MPASAETAPAGATIRARTAGYLVDMVIFAATAMMVVVFAGFLLLASTDWAQEDASDPLFYAFLAIIGLGTPLVWTVLNLSLLATRGQTGGQYVAAVRVVREDGSALSPAAAAAWWFSFNPVLFSWPLGVVAGLPLAATSALLVSRLGFAVFFLLISLCVASPLVALVSALRGQKHRALHDRLVGVVAISVA